MHEQFMRRCLELAEKGRGKTGVNPMVGAVLVRDAKVIAEGFHSEFGKAHAELHLVQNYEQKIRSNDTFYVNLEPCCHTHKKTPPCAQMLIERGIKNVVIGMRDPNPAVAGKGIELFRANGVNVTVESSMTAECLRFNRGFVSLMRSGRPWITLKSAVTSDGRFANPDGSPLRITSPEQDSWSHEFLRARHDAILVGVSTVIGDDPQLTVRFLPSPSDSSESGGGVRGGGKGRGDNYRIILDPTFRIPIDAKVVNVPLAERTIIITGKNVDQEKKRQLEDRGVRIFSVSFVRSQEESCTQTRAGFLPALGDQFDWSSLWKALITPAVDFHGISSILVEGGQKTWGMFRSAGMVDEEVSLIGI